MPATDSDMANKQVLLRCTDYEPMSVKNTVQNLFDNLGGVGAFIKTGQKVLLKVNLVAAHRPEKRVTTDPAVVRAVAECVLDAGGYPVIADSPGIDNFNRVADISGLLDVAKKLNIPCVELTDPVPLRVEGAFFQKIEVARLVLEADTVINLPKLKTHGQMLLTLGVKNLFGCVVAQRKAEWHYKVGLRREIFASLLLDLWDGIRPALTIIDGIIGMDGYGPTNGTPYPYAVLAGATDALALDFRLCGMLGVPLDEFPLWQAAKTRDMPQCVLDNNLHGDLGLEHRFSGVLVPKLSSLNVLPAFPFSKLVGSMLTSRPEHRPERCIRCDKCVSICKAEAIKVVNGKFIFDYKKCIRCYCCHEMCPADAIAFRDGLGMKLMKFFGK